MAANRSERGSRPLAASSHVRVDEEGLAGLDAQLGSRMGPVELLHVLIGYLPEFIDEVWVRVHEYVSVEVRGRASMQADIDRSSLSSRIGRCTSSSAIASAPAPMPLRNG